MSNDESRETKPDQKAAPKSDAIPDLTDAKVSEKDADQVKGGLNPQPLPPRYGR